MAFVSCGDSKKEFDPNNATAFEWVDHVAPDELKSVDDFKTFASGKFYFKTEAEQEGMKIEGHFFFDGTKAGSMMVMDLSGKTMKSLYKDGYSYTIIEQEKKYCKSKDEDGSSDLFSGKVEEMTYAGVEDKEIDGKAAKAYTFKTKAKDGNTDSSDDLVIYIADKKIAAFDFGGEPTVVKDFSAGIPSGLFDVPSDYTEVSEDDLYAILYS